MSNPERKFVRIQKKGQVTLPVEVRRKLGLKQGDLVGVEETPAGVLLTPKEAVSRIGDVLQARDMTLDDFIQTSDAQAAEILKEALGLPPDASDAVVQERAKADFFTTVDEIRRRNQDKDPEEVYRDVTAVVEEVRQRRYEQQKP